MRIAAILLLPLIGLAQSAPPPLLQGVVLERDSEPNSGEFSIRAADFHVFRYRFDRKTYVERDNQLIDVPRLNPGDKVEVVSDVTPGLPLRYARTVHVLSDPPRPAQSLGRVRASRGIPGATGSADRLVRVGTLTYSGVVSRVSPERLVLRLRSGEDQTILLRGDTRYLEEGEIVELADLKPNMRVFVRAGKDVYQQVEAYQVIWGVILAPR